MFEIIYFIFLFICMYLNKFIYFNLYEILNIYSDIPNLKTLITPSE